MRVRRWTPLRARLRMYPALREMLARCGFCPVCGQAFLETWLECVRFIEPRKVRESCFANCDRMRSVHCF